MNSVLEQDPEQAKLALGLVTLQTWLGSLYSQSLAQVDKNGCVHIQPAVANRFALGFVGANAFVVMPLQESLWAEHLPWSHAAIRRNKSMLHLVTEPVEIDGVDSPPFCMYFTVQSQSLAQPLQHCATLQLRQFVQTEGGMGIKKTPFASMPLILMEERDDVFEARKLQTVRLAYGIGKRR